MIIEEVERGQSQGQRMVEIIFYKMLPLQEGRTHQKILSRVAKEGTKATNLDRSHGSGKRFDRLFVSSETTLVKDDYESSILMTLSSVDDYEWIMNSRCSFNMTPNHLWFQEFTKLEGGLVSLVTTGHVRYWGIARYRRLKLS